MTSLTLNDYTIAWICALPLEAAAASAMLDKTHTLSPQSTDPNAYELGELNGHHIVIAHLPASVYGTVSAATVVSRIHSTFPRLQFGLMRGGPGKNNDIQLGDVVVSKPGRNHSGVMQYDYGKAVEGGKFKPTGTLNKPPQTLLTHMSQLEARQMIKEGDAVSKIMQEVLERTPNLKDRFYPPKEHADFLFCSSYRHIDKEDTCEKCDKKQLVERPLRNTRTPYIHYGLVASGDQVMKDSEMRDQLAQQYGILCFEMEAAGLMDELSTLKQWQGYAALTAATYAKLLLSVMPIYCTDSSLRHWVVSLARNLKFIGRQDEITKLEGLITMRDGPRRVAITGLGGVRKTQVALELAHRIQDQDRECSIFWILGLHDTKAAEAKKQIKIYLSSKHAGKWLLIFDNADDTEMWLATSHTAPALEDLLPESEQGRILFTTQNQKLAMKLAPFNTVPIPDVDKETALKILQRTLACEDLLKVNITTATLLEQLAFLPLAITQASAYIIENSISLSMYLALLQEQEQAAIELLSKDFRDPGRYKDIQNPVITTWLISFKQIQRQDQLAADYLSFMACIDPQNISQSLLPLQSSKKRRIDALGLLSAYSFTNSQDMDISIHRLVHIATRNWLRKNGLLSHWIQRVADQIQEVFPDNHYTNQRIWREYLPHALALMQGDKFIIKQNIDLVERIADCLASDGKYQEAEVLYKELMEIYQERNRDGHSSTLTSMANLASTYRHQGRWNEAEKLEVQVMETSKTVLGAEHPDTLTSMANLALTYQNQGQWNKAEKLEVQVMEASKTVLGSEHPSTLTSMANLASTYQNQGRWNEAEKLEVQVMETSKTVLGSEHPDTLTSMANLASTYQHQGRWIEAEKLEVQVMETRMTVLGAEHPDTLTSMANLAYTWQSQRRLPDALALKEACCQLRNKVLGPDHPDTRDSFHTLKDWEDQHNSLPNENLPPSAAAATMAQPRSEEDINLPRTQRQLATGFFLQDHPIIIASRALSPAPGSQGLHEVD
ncbi:LOW QUALITY PROTEIN: hypothetical protein IFM46972_11160 [Aspergillus udagawae]|uniref:Nucleoside phosphorylase domain-containing protein n=1 Tax=Aspergillus udagawae TaxID=91492 RepID=A0A8H3XRQ2_9EURO|nr:LOW QUALITY PROTEIN: hypothetical protein IFM46972_11160 [Aspergillus udagawae]